MRSKLVLYAVLSMPPDHMYDHEMHLAIIQTQRAVLCLSIHV